VFQPINQDVEACGEPLVAVVDPDVFAQATRAGKRSGGSDRKNWCNWPLVAGSRTCCSLIEVDVLLTAKPMV
jgi:hypothetical protein